jgi:predicted peptidase
VKLALYVLLSIVVTGSGCAGQFDAAQATGFQTIERKEGRYWAYVPNDAAQREQRGELLPVLVYLHDADERGDEPEQATQGALGKLVEQSHGQFPCVVLFPLLGPKHRWGDVIELQRLDRTIEDALHRVGGDPDRVYVTGVGLGASGAWQLAAAFPGRFAALVPIAGAAEASIAPGIGKLPVWALHGSSDSVRPPTALVGALGATAKLTLLGGGHDIAARAYREPGLVEWLLAQKRATTAADPAAASK